MSQVLGCRGYRVYDFILLVDKEIASHGFREMDRIHKTSEHKTKASITHSNHNRAAFTLVLQSKCLRCYVKKPGDI